MAAAAAPPVHQAPLAIVAAPAPPLHQQAVPAQNPPNGLVQAFANPNLVGMAMQLVAIGYQGGLASAYGRGDAVGGAMRSHRLAMGARPASIYQGKCKLCSRAVTLDLVSYDPERQGLKCCSEDCGKPLVYHQECIKRHMVEERVACFNVACDHCTNHVKVSRELAFSPSGAPYLIWRLLAWAWAHLVFWPAVCYPLMYMFFWAAAMLSWYSDPKSAPYPGIPGRYSLEVTLTDLDGTEDLWIINSLADRWKAAVTFYWAVTLLWQWFGKLASLLVPTRLKELANPYNWLFNYR